MVGTFLGLSGRGKSDGDGHADSGGGGCLGVFLQGWAIKVL